MRPTRTVLAAFLLAALPCAAGASAGASAPSLPLMAPPETTGALGEVVPILWDQRNLATGTGWISQDFEASLDPNDAAGADDFTVPPGEIWQVMHVVVSGFYFESFSESAGPTPAVDVVFYADAGDVPGEEISRQRVTPPTSDSAGDLLVELPAAIELLPGHYWLSVVAVMDWDPYRQWAWEERSVQAGAPGRWRNPGDGWETGCTDWGTRAECLPTPGVDLMFQLNGYVKGETACNSGLQDFEDVWPPQEWKVYALETGTAWGDNGCCGEANYTGGSGLAACASSDNFGAGAYDTWLRSPGFGLLGVQSAVAFFRANFQSKTNDAFDFDLSVDGGVTWTTLLHWTEDHGAFESTPGEWVEVDLAPFVGTTGLLARLRYFDTLPGAWDWYVQVDDIGLTCPLFADGFECGSCAMWSLELP